jgi:hypothetical protein
MKKLCFVLFFCLAAALGFAQTTLDTAIHNGAAYLRGRLPRNTRVAVLNMQSGSPELADYMLRRISAALVNDGWFTVIERDAAALAVLAGEMSYQLSGDVSDETSLSLGRQLGAECVLSGAMGRLGSAYRLELKAVRVESAEIAGQWYAENIRSDPLWADLDRAGRRAALVFTGDALSERDRQALGDSLGRALEAHKTPLELDLTPQNPPSAGGYVFTVNFYSQQTPSAAPANTALLQGELSLALSRNGRVLRRGGPYRVTDLTLPLLVRRGAEQLQNDLAFFQTLNEAVKP